MQFNRRATVRHTQTARLRTWRAIGAPVFLEEIKSLVGLPTIFLVVRRLENENEFVISRHRTRAAAERAANKVIT